MERVASRLTKVITRQTANYGTKPITLEAASLARFANGACTCSLGNTSVLVTAVSLEPTKPSNNSFVPLTVDYRQKAAAAGRIPMTHLRRDIGTSEKEVLTSRIIDRSIRPAFPTGFNHDTQIVCNLLAVDGQNDPDVLAINGASTSLAISDIPWTGPVGAVRMGLIGEKPVPNPTRQELNESRLNLVMAANAYGNIVMLDGSCREPILRPDILKAIRHGIKECRLVIESIAQLQRSIGKPKRKLDLTKQPSEEHLSFVDSFVRQRLEEIFFDHTLDKTSRDDAIKNLRLEMIESSKEKFVDQDTTTLDIAFSQVTKNIHRQLVMRTNTRADGRKLNELRPIDCKVNLYKPLHGSALFQRGQTQVFCSTTFDSPDAAARVDPITLLTTGFKEKNFMLHYEFPPYATNEIGRVTSLPGRREIGHGALAENGIRPVIPPSHEMTIRLNCEVLESNGSSSMASVCAGSLSLMDAGVAIKEHVAGVAIGLLTEFKPDHPQEPTEYVLMTDILGYEDYAGDMDFKIAGTKKAYTALQLDVKLPQGLSPNVLYEALSKGHEAKAEIIRIMNGAIKAPRAEIKENHPVMKTIYVPPHKVSKFVGIGGINLKRLFSEIGVRVTSLNQDLDRYDADDQVVLDRDNFSIFAPNSQAMREAEDFIQELLEKEFKEPELEFNGIYTATIREIRPTGVMVTLYPNMSPALVRLSQLALQNVQHPSALNLEVGQEIQVKYFGRDPASGQMRLSRKSLLMTSTPRVNQNAMTQEQPVKAPPSSSERVAVD